MTWNLFMFTDIWVMDGFISNQLWLLIQMYQHIGKQILWLYFLPTVIESLHNLYMFLGKQILSLCV